VFLSTILASVPGVQIGQLHKDKEDVIRQSGLPGKFVRPGAFMTNAYQWIGKIKGEGVVYNSMGDARFAPIAPEDVAAVAVAALTKNHAEDVFELTGGQLLSVPEQVAILAGVIGRPIRCVDESAQARVRRLIQAGVPVEMAEAVGQSFDALRDARATAVTDTIDRVTGRPPRTFEAWARDHASRFA
jgi:uncharacterized protein YbjT (DUF2867 family)